jgi:CRISPR-associated Csx2 family protein
MARVYLSFLGTTDYLPCSYYQKQLGLVENVRFVQEATIKLHCKDWGPGDRIFIFTTEDAEKKNWHDNGHVDSKTGKILKRNGLKKGIRQIGLNVPAQSIKIPEGKSEEEIWEIFRIIFGTLNDGDELVFDITHAFRSIPMLAIVVLNYAKVLKKVVLRGIYYGAFETLGSIAEARGISLDKRQVPILNLTSFNQLMEWSVAIDRFIETGSAGLVSDLTRRGVEPILRQTKGRAKAAAALKKFGNGLDTFTKVLATCRGKKISEAAEYLKIQIDKCKKTDLLPLLKPLVERISLQIEKFEGDPLQDGLNAAKWCYNHNLIQQAFTILQETLIGYFVARIGQDPQNLQSRGIASQATKIYTDNVPETDWHKPAANDKTTTYLYRKIFQENSELIKMMKSLSNCRNDLNHAGHKQNPMPAESFGGKLSEFLIRFEPYLKKID